MEFDYISYRKNTRTGRYKLLRRSSKMLQKIGDFATSDDISILDVGAADGFMVHQYRTHLKVNRCLGIEPSMEFIRSSTNDRDCLIQAVGESMPFKDAVFDVVTAASVLDHMKDPALFLSEVRRVLKQSGIVMISMVHPFYDRLAVIFKIKEDDHHLRFTERQLAKLLANSGFMLKEMSRFALPFFGMFFDDRLERIFDKLGMRWIMFYMFAIGQTKRINVG